jgi:hypothetical protein
MTTKRPKPDQIFPTREAAEAMIAELQASLDPGERRYEIVSEVSGYSLDVYRRDGSYAGPL